MILRAGYAIRFAVAALVLLLLFVPARGQSNDVVADQVREVFRKHCAECHGSKQRRADLNVLNAVSLFRRDRPVVTPRDPNDSELLQLVEGGTMPPGPGPKVPEADRKLLRDWIAAGALPFPPESSDLYALTKILRDVRAAKNDPTRDLADERYVTLNHLLASDDTAADLDRYRAALNKALNQLSTKPVLVALRPIDPIATIYRIKLSELGWDFRPFYPDPKSSRQEIDATTVNLYDLLLLDYPLASLPDTSTTVGEGIVTEYLAQVKLLRPIPYLYGDWLASVATQAPLYNDLLRLPLSLAELEKRLNFGANVTTERAALTKSAVVRGDRLIERRSSNNSVYWRTYDRPTRDDATLLADAAAVRPDSGGAAIFRLPNGLPGYFVADMRGVRLDAIPATIVHESLAKEGVGSGLSCMICHANGLHKLAAEGRFEKEGLPATFPKKAAWDQLLDGDNAGFAAALRQTLLGLIDAEPLGPVSRRFRQDMTQRRSHPDVTLVNLDVARRKPSLLDASFVLNRDAALPMLDHGHRPSATPLVPIDALGSARFVGKDATVKFELDTVDAVGTSKTAFIPDPEMKMRLAIKNTGTVPLYFEVALTGTRGSIYLFRPQVRLKVEPNKEKPNEVKPNEVKHVVVTLTQLGDDDLTKQRFIVYAAAEEFPAGVVLNDWFAYEPKSGFGRWAMIRPEPGYSVGGRVVHPFYKIDGKKIVLTYDPSKMVRQTIEFETLAK